ncbi:MAG: MBL fold metallo-hydrolase [Methanomassiliicoccales archaeon]|jgi:glyoxylase-like metal-dependent hydrolase (beta-lactamase superfamily II)
MKPEVRIVCEGLIVRDGQTILEAHSSSTLVVLEGKTLIVDTSSRANRQKVIVGLAALRVHPEDIDLIVSTHPHGDHVGNDDLFASAKRIELRQGEERRDIAHGARLVATPGHTRDSVSMFVEAEERYAIVGDAIPTEDNYRKSLPPGINYDREVAMASMRKIIEYADVVVPGHGRPFRIDR